MKTTLLLRTGGQTGGVDSVHVGRVNHSRAVDFACQLCRHGVSGLTGVGTTHDCTERNGNSARKRRPQQACDEVRAHSINARMTRNFKAGVGTKCDNKERSI